MCARALLLAVMFCLVALAPPPRVQAQPDVLEPELQAQLQAPFHLVLNQVDHGEIVAIVQDGDILVRRQDLLAAGLAPLEGRDVTIRDQRYLSLRSVAPPLHYVIDEVAIELRIEAPIELLPTTRLDVARGPPDMSYRRDTAAFFNYAASLTDRGLLMVYNELAASIRGNLLFTSAYISNEQLPRRGLTNFTIDDRAKLQRLVLGDALVTSSALGSSRFIGGATLTRTYALDPYAVKSPHLGHVGTTLTPATLDVYVNGARVYAEQLQPGTFQLDNLRVGGGQGTATYVLRDVFGREQTISNPYYVSSGTLAKGLYEYTYSLGLLRGDMSTKSWGYHRPAVLAYQRMGLTDVATLGFRTELSDDRISGGPVLDMLTPFGFIEAEIGGSGGLFGAAGLAGFVSYSYASRVFGAGVYGRVMTDRYVTLSLNPEVDRPLAEVGAFESMPLSQRVSVALQQGYAHYRDRGTTARLSGQLSWMLAGMSTMLVSMNRLWSEQDAPSWELFASVSYSFDRGHMLTETARLNERGPELAVTANKSLPMGPGYGYRATTAFSEHSSTDGLVQYQSQFGRYGLSFRLSDAERYAAVEAAGSLVLVPGAGLFASLPVYAGFGLIRVPGVANVRGYLNNQEVGRTDRNGNLLVPNMLSYYGNRLGIASQDVPIQYELPATELTLAPPYRGAAIANFTATLGHYLRGHVVIYNHQQRKVPAYGELHIKRAKDDAISPLGDNAEFEVENLEPGVHKAFVVYDAGRCEFEIEVPETTQTLIELGELACHTAR